MGKNPCSAASGVDSYEMYYYFSHRVYYFFIELDNHLFLKKIFSISPFTGIDMKSEFVYNTPSTPCSCPEGFQKPNFHTFAGVLYKQEKSLRVKAT